PAGPASPRYGSADGMPPVLRNGDLRSNILISKITSRGLPRGHGACAGTNSAIAPATAAGLSTGTQVLAPGTETSVARGKSDASRRACDIGKKPHPSPPTSRTGR